MHKLSSDLPYAIKKIAMKKVHAVYLMRLPNTVNIVQHISCIIIDTSLVISESPCQSTFLGILVSGCLHWDVAEVSTLIK